MYPRDLLVDVPRVGTLRSRPSTRICIFFNPQLYLCGYVFRPHVSGVSGIRIPNFLDLALQSGNV